MKNLLDKNGYIEALLQANVSQGESGQKYAQEMIARLRGDEETVDGKEIARSTDTVSSEAGEGSQGRKRKRTVR